MRLSLLNKDWGKFYVEASKLLVLKARPFSIEAEIYSLQRTQSNSARN